MQVAVKQHKISERAQKRIQDQGKKCLDNQNESSSKLRRSTEASNDQSKCFFCGESAGKEALHEASTFQLDKNVRRAATLIGDMELLGRLSAGDMVALEAKYHTIAYQSFTIVRELAKNNADNETNKDATISGIVYTEFVMFLEKVR